MPMSDVTRILSAIEQGDPAATDQLLPLVYDELRRLAAAQLAHEKPGHTLDATALVHEAWIRLAGGLSFPSTGHFVRAAAEAMRRILIDHARRKRSARRAGGQRFELSESDRVVVPDPETMLAVNEALEQLAARDAETAELAQLRLFVGLSIEEAARSLGISRATAYRTWAFARAWLTSALGGENNPHKS
jgi:RNA polymerase sigma factor (TIGR02999 family)